MFMRMARGLCLLLLLQTVARAEDLGKVEAAAPPQFVDEGWKSIHRHVLVRLEANGLGEETFDFEYRATTHAGVEAIANETFDYDPNFEVLSFEGLQTVKADGSVVPVDPRAIHDQPVSADPRAPYIDDRRQKMVAFPDVEPGDVIRGKVVTRTIKTQLGPGYTSYWSQRPDTSDEDFRVVVDAPAELRLSTAVDGAEETTRKENGRVIHTVVFPRKPPHVLTEAADTADVGPRYDVSTFKSYAEFAKTVSEVNAANAIADAAIKSEVARIVEGAADSREKAKRLSDWVAEHIRYAGIGIGNGGFASEPAATTFAERYGDCKAHATLLKAMLAEVGVEAHLALVGTRQSYKRPPLPVDIFDHEIVYLPAFDIYLDPTDAFGVFGAPLIELGGKPALDLATGELRTLPLATPDDMKLVAETHVEMSPEGVRSGDSLLTGERNGEAYRRYETTTFCDCGDTTKSLEAILVDHYYHGSGAYAFADARKLGLPFAIKAHFAETQPWDIKRFGAAILVDTPVDPSMSPGDLVHRGVLGRAGACFPLDLTETDTFKLPEGVDVVELNPPLAIDDTVTGRTALGDIEAKIMVRAEFSVQDRVITQTDHVRVGFSAPVCSSEVLDHVYSALHRFREYRYTWIPLSTGAWYQPSNWVKTMTEAASAPKK